MLALTLIASVAVFSVNASPLAKRSSTTCAILGFDKSPSYFYSTDPTVANFPGCEAACNADSNCLSFSVGYSDPPQCNLYNLPLIENVNPMDVYNDFVFYDKGCTVELVPTPGTTGLPLPAQVCGLEGFDVDSNAYYVVPPTQLLNLDVAETWAPCNQICLADPNCHSFAVGRMTCYLYFVGASGNTNPVQNNMYWFYDRACPTPAVGYLPSSPTTSSTSVITPTPGTGAPPFSPESIPLCQKCVGDICYSTMPICASSSASATSSATSTATSSA